MRRRHGYFYSMGLPSLGNPDCPYHTLHVVCDPREYVPVIKAGGAYPSGLVENLWVSKDYNESRNIAVGKGLMGRGAEWKRLRTFMQKDMLHPDSARGYVPGMIQAGELASRGAWASRHNLNDYMRRCAFDFFASTIFGELTQVSDPNTPTDPDNERFVVRTAAGLSTSIQMLLDPWENVKRAMGITSSKAQLCFEAFDDSREIGLQKIEAFTKRKAAGQLTLNEENSYLSRALDRQLEENANVSIREVQELAFTGLSAAVDTTGSVMGWNLFHVARTPPVQEKLYRELKQSVEKFGVDGRLTLEALSKDHVPYLHAVIRESNRVSPAGVAGTSKQVDTDNVTIFNTKMSKGDVVSLDMYSIQNDPEFVDNPDNFEPEMWLPDAVEARKGTPKEVIDHPYLKDAFSQGARKCPAARVAINEIQVLLAQWVLDWKISSPVADMKDISYSQKSALEAELPELDFVPRK